MTKLQEAIVLILMLGSFSLGYMMKKSTQGQVDTEIKAATIKDSHVVITTVTSKQKNGDVKVTKTIDSDVKKSTKKDTAVVATPPSAPWNISVTGGYDLSKPRDLIPIYGISINRQILGPVTIGAYGLTNGILGISLGVNF